MLASRVIGFVSSGAYPTLPNTPMPRSVWPLISFLATVSGSSFTERYCEKFSTVTQLSDLKLIGRPSVEGKPTRTPTAWGIASGDNGPNGLARSNFGLFVQLNCAQDWPGKPPNLYEKIDAAYMFTLSKASVARLFALL